MECLYYSQSIFELPGVMGFFLYVLNYTLLTFRFLSGDSLTYFAVNLCGVACSDRIDQQFLPSGGIGAGFLDMHVDTGNHFTSDATQPQRQNLALQCITKLQLWGQLNARFHLFAICPRRDNLGGDAPDLVTLGIHCGELFG